MGSSHPLLALRIPHVIRAQDQRFDRRARLSIYVAISAWAHLGLRSSLPWYCQRSSSSLAVDSPPASSSASAASFFKLERERHGGGGDRAATNAAVHAGLDEGAVSAGAGTRMTMRVGHLGLDWDRRSYQSERSWERRTRNFGTNMGRMPESTTRSLHINREGSQRGIATTLPALKKHRIGSARYRKEAGDLSRRKPLMLWSDRIACERSACVDGGRHGGQKQECHNFALQLLKWLLYDVFEKIQFLPYFAILGDRRMLEAPNVTQNLSKVMQESEYIICPGVPWLSGWKYANGTEIEVSCNKGIFLQPLQEPNLTECECFDRLANVSTRYDVLISEVNEIGVNTEELNPECSLEIQVLWISERSEQWSDITEPGKRVPEERLEPKQENRVFIFNRMAEKRRQSKGKNNSIMPSNDQSISQPAHQIRAQSVTEPAKESRRIREPVRSSGWFGGMEGEGELQGGPGHENKQMTRFGRADSALCTVPRTIKARSAGERWARIRALAAPQGLIFKGYEKDCVTDLRAWRGDAVLWKQEVKHEAIAIILQVNCE
ncbi:hypothetical protein R3P38DRAFT_2768796 [Favolaschia claudopus]|uniref:Uncharacterized protein n=1 Tax=Favolaschia claudopus TaxID=2862362 RepID=A0AAW0CQN0_9AGAR